VYSKSEVHLIRTSEANVKWEDIFVIEWLYSFCLFL
jgi:hypothetical protein